MNNKLTLTNNELRNLAANEFKIMDEVVYLIEEVSGTKIKYHNLPIKYVHGIYLKENKRIKELICLLDGDYRFFTKDENYFKSIQYLEEYANNIRNKVDLKKIEEEFNRFNKVQARLILDKDIYTNNKRKLELEIARGNCYQEGRKLRNLINKMIFEFDLEEEKIHESIKKTSKQKLLTK